jgi:hypothetical protein
LVGAVEKLKEKFVFKEEKEEAHFWSFLKSI